MEERTDTVATYSLWPRLEGVNLDLVCTLHALPALKITENRYLLVPPVTINDVSFACNANVCDISLPTPETTAPFAVWSVSNNRN